MHFKFSSRDRNTPGGLEGGVRGGGRGGVTMETYMTHIGLYKALLFSHCTDVIHFGGQNKLLTSPNLVCFDLKRIEHESLQAYENYFG